MSKETLLDIKSKIDNYNDTVILETQGFSFNQSQVVDLIERYWDSQFLQGTWDGEQHQHFYNVVKFPTRIASKMIDLDTKDIRFIAEEGQSFTPVFLFNKELKAWMKEKNFGMILNEIVQNVPKYGNYVLKVIGDDLKPVRLANLTNDPNVEQLSDSAVVSEKHLMTVEELMAKRGTWENIDEVIELFKNRKDNSSYIRIDEIYSYNERGHFDDSDSKEFVRGVTMVYGMEDLKHKKSRTQHQSNEAETSPITLFKSVQKKLPYYEFYFDSYQGRWLRPGVVEELLEEQMRTNLVVNEQAKGLSWTVKKIFQTQDMMVNKNLLNDVQNGDILRVNSEITPIANEDRNLAAFNVEMQTWDKNRREKSMTFEATTGETLPSGTPFRLGFILQQAASGYFDFKRENLGLLVRKLIYEVIAPTFRKSKRRKHLFNFYGEDSEFQNLEELMIEFQLFKQLKNFVKKTNQVPTEEEINRERENALRKLRLKQNRVIDIPEGFYDDLKFKVDIVVTNEQVAIDAKMQSLITILQTLATNPTILQNQTTKRILFKILDLSGVSPEELRETVGTATGQELPPELLEQLGQSAGSPPPGAGPKPELQLSSNQSTL